MHTTYYKLNNFIALEPIKRLSVKVITVRRGERIEMWWRRLLWPIFGLPSMFNPQLHRNKLPIRGGTTFFFNCLNRVLTIFIPRTIWIRIKWQRRRPYTENMWGVLKMFRRTHVAFQLIWLIMSINLFDWKQWKIIPRNMLELFWGF